MILDTVRFRRIKALLLGVSLMAVLLVGCKAKDVRDENSYTNSTDPTLSAISNEEKGDTRTTGASFAVLERYIEQYQANAYWQDPYVAMKYYLLSEDQLVVLLAIPGSSQTTAIPFSSISQYRAIDIGGVTVVTITDRTGVSTAINISAKESGDFIKMLTDAMA